MAKLARRTELKIPHEDTLWVRIPLGRPFYSQCSKEVLHLTFARIALIGRALAEKPGVDGSSPSPSAKSGLRGFESLHCDHLIPSFIVIANKIVFC